MNSPFNNEGDYISTAKGITCGYKYNRAHILDTNEEQDNSIRETFLKSSEESYNLFGHNCADVVSEALQSALEIDQNKTIQNNNFLDLVLDITSRLPFNTQLTLPSYVLDNILQNKEYHIEKNY